MSSNHSPKVFARPWEVTPEEDMIEIARLYDGMAAVLGSGDEFQEREE